MAFSRDFYGITGDYLIEISLTCTVLANCSVLDTAGLVAAAAAAATGPTMSRFFMTSVF